MKSRKWVYKLPGDHARNYLEFNEPVDEKRAREQARKQCKMGKLPKNTDFYPTQT